MSGNEDFGNIYYRQFIDGDEEAFTNLMREYRIGLTVFLYNILHDEHIAEEIAIDSFAELALNAKHFRGQCSVKTYLYAIGRNKALKYLRKFSREYVTEPDVIQKIFKEFADSPEMETVRDEKRGMIVEAMGSMKQEYQEALMHVYFEEMSYAEAARVMNMNNKQIANLLVRGKKRLKKWFEERGVTQYDE